MSSRSGWVWIVVGALSAALSVVLGAVGAHWAGGVEPAASWLKTAQAYHMPHALALILVGLVLCLRPGMAGRLSAWALALGSLCFSGGLYFRALADVQLGPIVPLGGVLMILGWLLLAVHAGKALSLASTKRS